MRTSILALALLAAAITSSITHDAGAAIGMTDGGSPDYAAIERLLDDNRADARRRLVEAIGAMDAYTRKATPTAPQLVILGRAYLRAMGNAGGFRAGELATRALKLEPNHGGAHLLLAEIAAYAQCATCADTSLANARTAGVEEASLAAMEGLIHWLHATTDNKNRAVGEAPPIERSIKAYERAVKLERNPARLASHRSALFELERMQGNHARAMEHGDALLAQGNAGESFIASYASFLLYERDDLGRAAELAARATSGGSMESGEIFTMILFRTWADAYLANESDPDNRAKLEAAKGANADFGAVFAKSLSSTATMRVAKALIRAGLVKAEDPGMRDSAGNTPLANAVAAVRADRAQANGSSPYAEPLNDEQFELVRMLLEKGANPNAFIAVWNRTVLGHAASRGDARVVHLLLKHRANVYARAADGSTALAEAAESRRHKEATEIAAVLISRKVAVSAVNRRGETALHAAARSGNAALIGHLVKAGADPMARDNSGWRPLEIATSSGHKEAVKSLLAAGAQVNRVVNECGSTNAVDIAKRMRNPELIELLRPHVKEGI